MSGLKTPGYITAGESSIAHQTGKYHLGDLRCPYCEKGICETRQDDRGINIPFCPDCQIFLYLSLRRYTPTLTHSASHFIVWIEARNPSDRGDNIPNEICVADNDIEHTEDDIAAEFIKTHLIAEAEHFLPTPEIYDRYLKFVDSRKHTPLKDQNLYKHIRERFGTEKTRRRIDGRLQYGFIGIQWRQTNNA